MASNTPNYELKKPAATDFYTVEDQNANMDKLDAALKGLADGKAPAAHAAQHAAGGSDPVTPTAIGAATAGHTHTPASIGAAPAVHTHDDRYFTEGESLSAATAVLFGLGSGAVPNDVFSLMGGGYRNIGKFVYLEFLESQSWVAPSGVQSNEITVLCCGGGGAHGNNGSHGGGGSGYITRQKVTITPGVSYNIIIGAGAGTGTAQGGTTSFDTLASALGGYSTSNANGGNGNAGGAANYGGKGGNGGEFGGGGGSIGTEESTSPGQGGNGGTYGGGGGGQPGGTGGTYGGHGGTLTVAAANGTPFNDPTNIYRENFPCLTGKAGSGNLAGGGGHGGVGGNGAYYTSGSYIRNIGGGGGGYGSYGGTPTSGLNNLPGSGGGYGGNGNASASGSSGGGGYFSNGDSGIRGAGGGGTHNSGGSGVCAIWYFKED